MQRRDFLKYSLGLAAILSPLSSMALYQKTKQPKIVICGAGFAGLSVANFLTQLNNFLNVTIIEKNKKFISCPFSNAYLGEIQDITLEDLTFSFKDAIKNNKSRFINEEIISINRERKEIKTKYQTIPYDILIMSVGIDYNYEALFSNPKTIKEVIKNAPAGYKTPFEFQQIKEKIATFTKGNFIISVPKGDYKCLAAPYERACMIAHYFKTHSIMGKVVLLDPNERPSAMSKQFLLVFKRLYSNYIEYIPQCTLKDIDFKNKEVSVEIVNKKDLKPSSKTISFEQANIIPPNKANRVIEMAKLELDEKGWAKLKRPTFQSSVDEDVYIVGDAQGEYPFAKTAQMASVCAFNVAKEIVGRLYNLPYSLKENMPGDIAYFWVSDKRAVSIMRTYTYKQSISEKQFISKIDEHTATAAKNWYEGFTASLFK